ncbi:MAG: hypothetical protein WC637_00160 [Victivallales bacterium]|jgi:hypothetical protein
MNDNKEEMVTVTATDKGKKKRGFLDWLVETFRPGYHISKNPPRGRRKYEVKGE